MYVGPIVQVSIHWRNIMLKPQIFKGSFNWQNPLLVISGLLFYNGSVYAPERSPDNDAPSNISNIQEQINKNMQQLQDDMAQAINDLKKLTEEINNVSTNLNQAISKLEQANSSTQQSNANPTAAA